MTQSWWLYLLGCRDGRTYVGIATDVAARFAVHISGKGAKFTRSNPPVSVLGARAFASKSEALKAEAALKKLDRARRLAWAREFVVQLPGLEGNSNSTITGK
ncbi:MAG TPA: GIY-YIG nuclease family protein [Steroidobacter sp.]|uniref:GIY-YIG nuclease family protein n=1 Tax=Steroidobacter sp. TaxID=1978227 RepID=UPI002ED8B915